MGHYIQDGKLYIDDVNIENEAFANLDLGEDLNVYLINTKVIGYKAFANAKIKSITIPYTVEYIGDYAFSGCKNITITHENTETKTDLSTIGKGAFMDCSNSNITIFFTGVDAKRLSDMVFYNCKGGYIYSDTVEFIGDSAFYNSNISINGHWDNLSKIGNYAFYNCTGDSVGTYCNNNITIGDYAFSGTTSGPSNITEIKLPNLLKLGKGAFANCKNLEKVILGCKLPEIPDKAFFYCKSLTNIIIPNTVSKIGSEAFSGCAIDKDFTINFGTHYNIPLVSAGSFYHYNLHFNSLTIITPDYLYDKWKELWEDEMSKYFTISIKKLSENGYISFNIDKYSFIGKKDTTWQSWIATDYSKFYSLPTNTSFSIFAYRSELGVDNRYMIDHSWEDREVQLSNTINWPSGDAVLDIAKNYGYSYIAVEPSETIEANSTYTVIKGAQRLPYLENGEWKYKDYTR